MLVKNKFLASQTATVSEDISKTGKLEFNSEGITEVSEEAGKLLLEIPDFEEVKEEKKAEEKKAKKEADKKQKATKDETEDETKVEDETGAK